MKHLLTAIACCLAVAGSAQTPYNPDVDGDGCITVTDVLGVLSAFNTCVEGVTIYYYTTDLSTVPYGGPIDDWSDGLTYVKNGTWHTSSSPEEFNEAMVWMLQNEGQEVSALYGAPNDSTIVTLPVQPVDSITNVSLPLSNSIPNGTIQFTEFENSDWPRMLIPASLYSPEFLFANDVFYETSNPCLPVNVGEWGSYWVAGFFEWQNEAYAAFDVCGVGEFCWPWPVGIINVYEGY